MDTKQSLIKIVQKETKIDLSKIDHDGDLREQVSLDSLSLISILAAIVEEMGINVPISIVTSRTFNEIVKAVDDIRDQQK
ncbi:phosphopantetheine-binding protein [Candidatus Latescibacterota bacterium]